MVKMPQSPCSSVGLSLHPHGFFNECTIIIELLIFNFSYYVVMRDMTACLEDWIFSCLQQLHVFI